METQSNPESERRSIDREPTTASEAVVEAVAAAEGVSPTGLSVPLYDAVDPDALDQLFTDDDPDSPRGVRRLSFPYAGYQVTVRGADLVTVDVVERDAGHSEA